MSDNAKPASGCTVRRIILRTPSQEQLEIKRLRGVLHSIANSHPWCHMDFNKTPELTNWICDTCHKACVGCYPQNASLSRPGGERVRSGGMLGCFKQKERK